MCSVFSHLDPDRYVSQTRSVRLGGQVTSIRLEASFWQVLHEIADAEGMSLGRFLTTLHDEVVAFNGEVQNFTSLLRCACLVHKEKQAELERAGRQLGRSAGARMLDGHGMAALKPAM